MEKRTISLHVNGFPYQIEIGPQTSLLELLRDDERLVCLASRWFLPQLAALSPAGARGHGGQRHRAGVRDRGGD
jgi:hypothetical protein